MSHHSELLLTGTVGVVLASGNSTSVMHFFMFGFSAAAQEMESELAGKAERALLVFTGDSDIGLSWMSHSPC